MADLDSESDNEFDFSQQGYHYEYDESDSEEDIPIARWLCEVCNRRVKVAVACLPCCTTFCRRDAKKYIHIERIDFDQVEDVLMYACNSCLPNTTIVSEEECPKGKVLTLEMLCAFNIARKMWEPILANDAVSPLFARQNSVSIMNSADKSYSCAPLCVRNLIKRAIFLLGLELDMLASFHRDRGANLIKYVTVRINTFLDYNKFDPGKSNSSINDEENCWKRRDIEWTPQFTIKNLDVDGYI